MASPSDYRLLVERHLSTRMSAKKCANCDTRDWIISEPVLLPWTFDQRELKSAIPAVPLTCRGCGDMQFIHLLSIPGLLPENPQGEHS